MNWQGVVESTVVGLGYELVDIERSGRGLVRVTIDRPAGDPRGEFIVVEDCERVTRQLQHVLEVEGGAYERLEVSSPGLDRPLRKEADFQRYQGRDVALTLKAALRGRKRFQGRLLAPEAQGGAADSWRLVLAEAAAPAAKKPARRGKPVALPRAQAVARAASADAHDEPAFDPVLEFRLDEVRDARLVPVVDFKGRRFLADEPPSQAGATPTDVEAAQ